jgi:general stress protein YciG
VEHLETQGPRESRKDADVKEGAVMEERPKARRGFRCMDPEVVRAIASKGGTVAHVNGRAHEWTYGEEAAAAGRKGGLASAARRRERVAE